MNKINVYIPFIGRLIHDDAVHAFAQKFMDAGLESIAYNLSDRVNPTSTHEMVPVFNKFWLIRVK